MKKCFFISLLFLFTVLSKAQNLNENWVPVFVEKDETLFINVTGLSNFTGNEIYIWSLHEMKTPMTMEEINGDIYKVKTYYLINKELSRYSILQIIFYDEQNNVLKSYNYENKYENPEFKYSYPIIRNSDVDKIFIKTLDFIKPAAEIK